MFVLGFISGVFAFAALTQKVLKDNGIPFIGGKFVFPHKAAQQTGEADEATVCPECDGLVEFCAMGHYVPAKSASSAK